jgi:hypothetical protein
MRISATAATAPTADDDSINIVVHSATRDRRDREALTASGVSEPVELPSADGVSAAATCADRSRRRPAVVMTDLAIVVTTTEPPVLRTPIVVGRTIPAQIEVADRRAFELSPYLRHLQHAARG